MALLPGGYFSFKVYLVHAQPFVGFRRLCRENLPPY